MKWYQKFRSLIWSRESALFQLDRKELEIGYAYFVYYIYGGAIFSKHVPHTIKCFYYVYNVLMIALCLVAAPTYYIIIQARNPTSINVSESMEALVNTGVIGIIIFSPLLSMYFYKNIETILAYFEIDHSEDVSIDMATNANWAADSDVDYHDELIDRCLPDCNWSPEVQGIQLIDFIRYVMTVQIYVSVCVTVYFTAPVFYVLFTLDGAPPNRLSHHILPIPFYDCGITQRIYYLVIALEVLLLVPLTIGSALPATLLMMITVRMNNIVYYFCRRIRILSDVFSKYFKKRLYLLDGDEHKSRYSTKFHEECEKDLYQLVNDYQDLTRHIQEIRPFIDFLCSISAVGSFGFQLIAIYLLLGTNESNSLKYRQLILATTIAIFIFLVGYIGKAYHDMNDAVRYEVYNVPWYDMNAKMKQGVHIFQNMVAKDWIFRVLFLYPMSMSLALNFFRSVFSYFNILRTILNQNSSSRVSSLSY